MTTLLLIRHGQSMTNLDKTFTGQYDAALNDTPFLEGRSTHMHLFPQRIPYPYTPKMRSAFL